METGLKNRTAVPSQDAERAFSRSVQLNPNDGYSLVALGVALYGLGEYEAAAQNIEAGIALEGAQSYSLKWARQCL